MPRNKNKGKQPRTQGQGVARLLQGPPSLETGTIVRQWYRYRSYLGNTPTPITVAGVLNACGAIASANGASGVTMYGVAYSARVRRIRQWSAAPNDTTQSAVAYSTVSVDFDVGTSSITASGLQYTDTTMSPAKLAFIDVVPPKGTFASFWHNRNEGGSTLFILNTGLSGIVDLDIEWILADDDAAGSLTSIASTLAGRMYYPPLDGSTAQFLAIGRQTA